MNFIDELIVVKVHPTRTSQSIPGSEYIQVDLTDSNDNFKYYKTYISDNLDNYAKWKTFFDEYEPSLCYMLRGHFRRKAPGRTTTGAQDLINGDAKFNIYSTGAIEDLYHFIKQELETV